uniref:Uncharacterized protein n=1 Tax=Eutreptiella gymnastica TaxID=73025 RepID=A0A7S1IMQ7_9EUGL|mmetsp:Transcript_27832/g.50213  ORF Transcript_27832/g.50213 Transcript_27832/m.50213 type:complete len:121 (+) Transcript_27832:33-395(+)
MGASYAALLPPLGSQEYRNVRQEDSTLSRQLQPTRYRGGLKGFSGRPKRPVSRMVPKPIIIVHPTHAPDSHSQQHVYSRRTSVTTYHQSPKDNKVCYDTLHIIPQTCPLTLSLATPPAWA